MKTYDVVVIGLGILGVSSAAALAKRGLSVLALDRVSPGHSDGSSFGPNRLFRKAYFEDERYIPMLKAAEAGWRELESLSGRSLLHQTGLLTLLGESSDLASQTLVNAGKHGIPMQELSADDIVKKWSAFLGDHSGIFEPEAGWIQADDAIRSFEDLAIENGAHVQYPETVQSIDFDSGLIATDKEKYSAGKIVLAAGAWSPKLISKESFFEIQKAPVYWLDEIPDVPCFAFSEGERYVYGFPGLNGETKIAEYVHTDVLQAPEDKPKEALETEWKKVEAFTQRFFSAEVKLRRSQVCMYTATPDENFLVGQDSKNARLVYATGGSGHAFKFAPVLSEIVADEVEGKSTSVDIGFLRQL